MRSLNVAEETDTTQEGHSGSSCPRVAPENQNPRQRASGWKLEAESLKGREGTKKKNPNPPLPPLKKKNQAGF